MNRLTTTLTLLVALIITAPGLARAQTDHEWLIGSWEGTLNAGGNALVIVYNLSEDADGSLTGTMDVPSQHAAGIPLTAITIDGASVSWQFQVPGGGRFNGQQAAFGSEIDGTFVQAGQSMNLDLKKQEAPISAPEFVEAYMRAISARDETALREMIVTGERFMWIEDGVVRYTSADGVLEGLRSLGDDARIETTLSDEVEQALGEDAVVYTAAFETSVGSGAGGFSFSGRMSLFLERTEAGFVLVGGHTSSARQ